MASERARPRAPPFVDPPGYAQHRPEATLLYRLIERYYHELVAAREAAGRPLPEYVQQKFEAYLKCGRLEHGFLRVSCEDCHAEKLVAFSCKRRGFCPSCGARRMTGSAALLADEVLPAKPIRQWVLSLPFALRFLLATDPVSLTQVLGIVYRTISAHLLKNARLTRASGATGAVTLIQRFGSALNLNIHFHMLVLDGAYLVDTEPPGRNSAARSHSEQGLGQQRRRPEAGGVRHEGAHDDRFRRAGVRRRCGEAVARRLPGAVGLRKGAAATPREQENARIA